MNGYKVILAVARGATFDTGRRIELPVLASSRLEAALEAERIGDRVLDDPELEYTHAQRVAPIAQPSIAAAIPVAA